MLDAANIEAPPDKITDPATLPLADLFTDQVFTPRIGLSPEHVHTLVRALRNGDLAPITVWQEPTSRRYFILDGRHRAAAYRHAKAKEVPVRVFHGDRNAARLEAAGENAKATFSWSTSECTQYAWGLVIEQAGSKSQIARKTNIHTRTVANMRKRLADMRAEGKEPSGNWFADRNGKEPQGQPEGETDAARMARINKLREYLNGTETRFKLEFGKKPTMEELGVAMRWHLGQPRFKAMLSGGFTADEDEFSEDAEVQPIAPLAGNPDEDF